MSSTLREDSCSGWGNGLTGAPLSIEETRIGPQTRVVRHLPVPGVRNSSKGSVMSLV